MVRGECRWTSGQGNRSMRVEPSVSLQMLRSAFSVACEGRNEIIAQVGEADSPIAKPQGKGTQPSSGASCSHRGSRTPCGPCPHHLRTD